MESSFQKIIAAIVSVMILFIIPVYIAFEKVDDISYSLAVKLTQNFVDNARNKGYISPDMYSDFVSGLYSTNNAYDVTIEHVKKRYDPAIYIYEIGADGQVGKLLHTLDYARYQTDYEDDDGILKVNIDGTGDVNYEHSVNCFIKKAHVINEEVITDKQIVAKLFYDTGVSKVEFLRQCLLGNANMYDSLVYMNENSYVMNEGDQIKVTVKNRNRTIASIFYSMFTANVGSDDIAKIYVNYGGTVKNDGEAILNDQTGSVDSDMGRIFKYRGQAEEVTLQPGKYEIQCWGAAGGYPEGADTTQVGKGAYAKAEFEIAEETTMYVYVGGKGSMYSETKPNNGGYNGGGSAYKAYGGGGATDVRLLKGDELDLDSLLTRIIVAAGAGGNSKLESGYGGSGGDLNAGINGKSTTTGLYFKLDDTEIDKGVGLGASSTQIEVGYSKFKNIYNYDLIATIPESERGGFGIGGSVDFSDIKFDPDNPDTEEGSAAGAGGSGYFGGSAAHDVNAGGGGGISYVYTNIETHDYPINGIVYNEYYDDNVFEKISAYIDDEGKWKNIRWITSSTDVVDGENLMPNGLTFNGLDEVFGNDGNGYAIIKKIGELGE